MQSQHSLPMNLIDVYTSDLSYETDGVYMGMHEC